MVRRWIIPVLVLPGTVLIIIPTILLTLSHWGEIWQRAAGTSEISFWIGIAIFLPGLFLAVSSGAMFFHFGKGTAAPWDPPREFVVRGPYRFVRNPMIMGAITILFAQATFFQSGWILGWAIVFALGNTLYFSLWEEPKLMQRFGEQYALYCQNVPRWVPRLTPWNAPWSC